ncbi:MAG: hypothetical protein P8N51_17815 [Pseudomonadales bacterium]|nr:hypothetical protein [Pseudomonadales bacterium]MDG1443754.1 hypothetical protein [Pseudomonadales bacterium]
MSKRYVEFLNLVDMFRSGVMSEEDVRTLKRCPDWELKKAFLNVLHEEVRVDSFEGLWRDRSRNDSRNDSHNDTHNVFAELLAEITQTPLKRTFRPRAKVNLSEKVTSGLFPSASRRKTVGNPKLKMQA